MIRPRALLSVTDKTGIVDFAKGLTGFGFEILSTGGTARTLREAGVEVTDVSQVTGFPEMLDGRVKTLHPMIHGGLLGIVGNANHEQAMQAAGIHPISVVAVNLYEFEKTVTKPHNIEEAIESIDIGGPAMIRASAKNHASVAVIVDPSDYVGVLESIEQGNISEKRRSLAKKAFSHTAYYDSVISRYLADTLEQDSFEADTLTIGLRKSQIFRYGENPHQTGALYRDPLDLSGLPFATQLWGKDLSYNNINDANGAWELVCDMPSGSCAIIKHSNPCGAAHGTSFGDSYRRARASDPISAFGGIAAFNGIIDEEAAEAMTEKGNFLEVVIGTKFTQGAVDMFKNRSGWGQDVRLLEVQIATSSKFLAYKGLRGGAIIQASDEDPGNEWQVVTTLKPTETQMRALKLQWAIVQHVKSNAIVVGNEHQLLGVGAGQMNRVQSVRLALDQAGEGARGAALASDAFFPFPDSIITAAAAGIAAVVQPGGSKKDADVIAKANELGIAMCLTGTRHFNH
jgi:phosphoribosylaminoimidazolecarboxamide formyltransferase / IMP cyclohydrolase